MKQKFLKLVSLSFLLSGTAFAAASDDNLMAYQYWVHVPATQKSCDEEASALALRFQAATGIANIDKKCAGVIHANFDQKIYPVYSIKINYRAEKPASIYHSEIGNLFDLYSDSTDQGVYTTYENCVNDLPSQSEWFKSATGLSPVTAYCTPSSDPVLGGYYLTVDGFGDPQQRLKMLHLSFGYDNPAQYDQILGLLTKHGATVVRKQGDVVLYYSKLYTDLLQYNFGLFRNISQCEEQLDSVKSIFMKSGSKESPLVTCKGIDQVPGAASLFGIADSYKALTRIEIPQKYFNYEECLMDRAQVIESYSKAKSEIDGAICVDDLYLKGQFIMTLYQH